MEKIDVLKNEKPTLIKPTPQDLKYIIKDFTEKQQKLLEMEKQEEEKQNLEDIYNYSAKVCYNLKSNLLNFL
jgi:hypothetical protein